MEETRFGGFGAGGLGFFAELAANNNRVWFQENQDRYERELLEPAAAFVAALGPRLAGSYPAINYGTQRNGSGSIMRIHRDVRFSPDKRPYKQHLGLVFWIGSGKKVELPCFYLHLAPERSFFYGGQHMLPRPVLERYRAAVDDHAAGMALVGILRDLERQGLGVMEEPAYKRVPQGFAKDHARADLLRYGGLGVAVDLPATVLGGPGLVGVCADFAAKVPPLVDWLCTLNG